MKKMTLIATVLMSFFFINTFAQTNNNMKINFFCPRWGSEDLSWDAFCGKVKKAGYNGIEGGIPADAVEKQAMLDALKKYDLLLIGMSFYGTNPDFNLSAKNFEQNLRSIAELKPVLINCHTGKDFMSFEQNKVLIEVAAKVSKETGIKILHETHRGRFTYAANVTKEYFERMPNLQVCLDISHWCNVHESLLDDQIETVNLALSRTDHIHARVGQQEAPQVSDPRAPEWADAVNHHLAWWDKIIETKRQKGISTFTITPEFGPAGYLPMLPYTKQPVANQWDINVYMMEILKKRYNQ